MDEIFAFLLSNWILYYKLPLILSDEIWAKWESNISRKKDHAKIFEMRKLWDTMGKANKNHSKKCGYLLTNYSLLDKLQSGIEFAQ